MFPSNAAAAKRLGKRRVREVTGESPEPFASAGHFCYPHSYGHHHRASSSIPVDGRRSQVHRILNNAAAAPFSYMALLTAADDGDDHDDHLECCPLSKDVTNPSDHINQMITFHNENLRQSVVGMVEHHQRAAEERAEKRLRASEERNAELERLVELYKGEAERLLARVRHLEHAAQSVSEAEEEAESSFEHPDRVGPVRLDCKVCERELATVMVWPCRHVCVCARCDAATKCCPVCRMVKTTSVQVCLPLD